MTVIGQGSADGVLSDQSVGDIVGSAVADLKPDGKKVMAIIPDRTRTCPLPTIVRRLKAELEGRAEQLDFLVALGTHPPLDDDNLDALLGIEPGKRKEVLGESQVCNHRWDQADALKKIRAAQAKQEQG